METFSYHQEDGLNYVYFHFFALCSSDRFHLKDCLKVVLRPILSSPEGGLDTSIILYLAEQPIMKVPGVSGALLIQVQETRVTLIVQLKNSFYFRHMENANCFNVLCRPSAGLLSKKDASEFLTPFNKGRRSFLAKLLFSSVFIYPNIRILQCADRNKIQFNTGA